jgi:secreted PhoX family phosphatase
MSNKHIDPIFNTSAAPHFQDVLTASLANPERRSMLLGGLGLAGLSVLPGCATLGTGLGPVPTSLGFPAVPKSLLDNVILPPGYQYSVLHATGDAMDTSTPAYANNGSETDDWSRRIGDHHDGMDIYYIDDQGKYSEKETRRAVLCVNHESSADAHFLHPNGQTSQGVSGKKFSQFGEWDLGSRPELEVLKEINLHGISVVEINKTPAGWRVNVSSALNRRITPQTPMRISGPRALIEDIRQKMVTRWDTSGSMSRGTLNNCGHGKTPWGTYLGCEENWAFYFQTTVGGNLTDHETASRKRYGLPATPVAASVKKATGQGWHTVSNTDDRFARWNLAAMGANAEKDFRNEANTFGYNVEIDPLTPNATPAKRTAMGRIAHEAAVCGLPAAGEPLAFYMGCDSRNEYIYKFVSTALWDPKDVGAGLVAGDKYLSEGRLYAAKFNADGTGEWLELSIADPRIAKHAAFKFTTQADICVNTRHAADAVGATPMDRPEWGAVNPRNGEIYFSLTNNSAANRTPSKVDAANPRAYMDMDGKKTAGNPNGHIIRFKESEKRSWSKTFAWDIFLFGAEEDAGDANLSGLTANNSFSSPDGLWFSKTTGICWIQTDDGAFTDETNCMMLAAIPGQVGDGGKVIAKNKMVVNGTEQTGTQETFISAALGEAKLRRFLVAPKGSEVTGITEADGGRTLFVNIQHPGELSAPLSSGKPLESLWPGNQGVGPQGRPRSATIVITRQDGGVIGL